MGSISFILLAIGWSINKVKKEHTIKYPYGSLDHLGEIGAYENK